MPILILAATLAAASLVALLIERRAGVGPRLAPRLGLKRDVLKEALFLAQYGQGTCLLVAAPLAAVLDAERGWWASLALIGSAVATFAATHAIKHLTGRVRPGRERDGHRPGAFLGPHLKVATWRESFPSSHAANAAAMSAVLAGLYPDGLVVWWTLAAAAAGLRWLLEAHWLSDVLAGAALGILCGAVVIAFL